MEGHNDIIRTNTSTIETTPQIILATNQIQIQTRIESEKKKQLQLELTEAKREIRTLRVTLLTMEEQRKQLININKNWSEWQTSMIKEHDVKQKIIIALEDQLIRIASISNPTCRNTALQNLNQDIIRNRLSGNPYLIYTPPILNDNTI